MRMLNNPNWIRPEKVSIKPKVSKIQALVYLPLNFNVAKAYDVLKKSQCDPGAYQVITTDNPEQWYTYEKLS